MPDIQDEFEIEQAGKAGFIQTAFVIMYAVGAPSFGYWGDRYSRKWLMIGGMVAWTTCILTATFMPVSVLLVPQKYRVAWPSLPCRHSFCLHKSKRICFFQVGSRAATSRQSIQGFMNYDHSVSTVK